MSNDTEVNRTEDGIRFIEIPFVEGHHSASNRIDRPPCTVCGRETVDRFYVIEGLGGGFALHPEDVAEFGEGKLVDGGGYLGGQAIGSTCRKRLPDEFVVDREED